jgi:CxxC motif-containing protein
LFKVVLSKNYLKSLAVVVSFCILVLGSSLTATPLVQHQMLKKELLNTIMAIVNSLKVECPGKRSIKKNT